MTEIEKLCRDSMRDNPSLHIDHEGGAENDDSGWKPRLRIYRKDEPSYKRDPPGDFRTTMYLAELEITTDWEDQTTEDKLRDAKGLLAKWEHFWSWVHIYVPTWRHKQPKPAPWGCVPRTNKHESLYKLREARMKLQREVMDITEEIAKRLVTASERKKR